MPHDVFISYSARDKTTADAACFALESKHIRCWIAPRDVLPGANWGGAIIDAIEEAKILVLIFSAHANQSEQVMRELERAVSKGIPILPVRIEDVPLSKAFEYYISSQHWLDALTPPIEQHLQRLSNTVQRLLTPEDDDAVDQIPKAPQIPSRDELSFKAFVDNPELLVGRRVGAFILRAPMGSGGSGFVFKARNPALGREVCVKIFRSMRGDFAAASATIARSVRALASIDHPYIIKVFDFGPFQLGDDSSFYLAMEMIEGHTLDEWSRNLADNEAALELRLQVALRLAKALETAHICRYLDDVGFEQTGLVHGDIKPNNVLVRRDNSPVLLDFMMADVQRLLELWQPSGFPRELTTLACGTPGFMAPEQEEKGVVTVRSDIYSLGMTFCHLFQSDPLAMMKHSDERLRRLAPLIFSMLSNDPANRPHDARAVVEQLRSLTGVDVSHELESHNLDHASVRKGTGSGFWSRFLSKLS